MAKKNCWEVKNCGRQFGGANAHELGICPASSDISSDGTNGGSHGGRVCWSVAGTFCGGKVQGEYAQKSTTCMSCEFFKQVKKEEGSKFAMFKPYHEEKKAA